jgi:hypothetical protein
MVSVTGIIINVFMLIFIIILIGLGITYNDELNYCINNESPACYGVSCPCDDKDNICKGNAKKKYGDNYWICSNTPRTVIDDNENVIKNIK